MKPPNHNQGNNQQQVLNQKKIGTEELKEIVAELNTIFKETEQLTLWSFDEKTNFELLELLNTVLGHIDESHKLDIRDETQDKTANRMCEFLRIMQFPASQDFEFQRGLIAGDPRIIHPVLHFLLTKKEELSQRAYLARFLTPVNIPPEFQMDQELMKILDNYKELQANFAVVHQNLEKMRSEASGPKYLKKEIQTCENEIKNLNERIGMMKTKVQGKKDFQGLLDATSNLRREQEEEALLMEKMREAKMHIEQLEQQIMIGQQRVFDMEKTSSSDTSAMQMLGLLKKDVSRNKDLMLQLNSELNEKNKKAQELNQALTEPSLTHKELEVLQSEVHNLRRANEDMDSKVKNGNPNDDKLAIQKQRLSLISKKRDKFIDAIKNFEAEQADLEEKVKINEAKLGGFKRENIKQLMGDIKAKNARFKQMSSLLKDIKNERAILANTDLLLTRRLDEQREKLHNLEVERNMVGLSNKGRQIQQVAKDKNELDRGKEELMEELSRDVEKITRTITEKKKEIEPAIQRRKKVNEELQKLEKSYQEKKQNFDNVTTDVELKLEKLKDEVMTTEQECSNQETRLFYFKTMEKQIDACSEKFKEEEKHLKGEKRLSSDHKSQKEMQENMAADQEGRLKKLMKEQQMLKENFQSDVKQTQMFSQLLQLLNAKLEITQNEFANAKRNVEQYNSELNQKNQDGQERLVLD